MFTLVIADDEKAACKRLELFTNREFTDIKIVDVVNDGYALVHSIEHFRPDIAIVDVNMPGLNGIQSIQLLSDRKIPTRFIINTAYDKFEYVKEALDLKVDAYLLKPEKKENFVEALKKVCESIRQERREADTQNQMRSLLQNMDSVLESDIIYSVMTKESPEKIMNMYCELHEIQFCGAAVATIFAPGFDTPSKEVDTNAWNKTVHLALKDLCNCIVSATKHGISLILLAQPDILKDGRKEEWISDLAYLALDELNREYPLYFRVGIGGFYEQISDLPRSYEESLRELYQEMLSESSARETQDAIGKWKDCLADIERLCESGQVSDYVREAIQHIGQNYAKDISLDSVAESIGISSFYLSRLISQELGITFVEYLTGFRMIEVVKLATSSRLSLKQIAERTGYPNATYLCKVFKKYAGKTIGQIRKETLKQKEEENENRRI